MVPRSKAFEISYMKKVALASSISVAINNVFRIILNDIIGRQYLLSHDRMMLRRNGYAELTIGNILIFFVIFCYCFILRSKNENFKAFLDIKYIVTSIIFFVFAFYIFNAMLNYSFTKYIMRYIISAKGHLIIDNSNINFVPELQFNKAINLMKFFYFFYFAYYNLFFMIFPSFTKESFIMDDELDNLDKPEEYNSTYYDYENLDEENNSYEKENLYEEEEKAPRFDEMHPPTFKPDKKDGF
ncbi:MAG: hypothetical protein LBV08_02865 [Clostridiales bacterium]|jgi:hypothetical protein|nr:hypothetical protein [Clostridiales bacterium]